MRVVYAHELKLKHDQFSFMMNCLKTCGYIEIDISKTNKWIIAKIVNQNGERERQRKMNENQTNIGDVGVLTLCLSSYSVVLLFLFACSINFSRNDKQTNGIVK